MAKFRATVRLSGVDGADPASVQHAVDRRLRQAGFDRWRVLSIEIEEGVPNDRPRYVPRPRRLPPPRPPARGELSVGGLLLIAVAAWMVWFLPWW